MPRKSIASAHRKPSPEQEGRLKVLFVNEEDEKLDRFMDTFDSCFECYRAKCGRDASRYLKDHSGIDLIFLTMSFPAVPREELLGIENVILDRFEGDEEKAINFVRKSQGAFILHHIRRQVEAPIPVLFFHDFSSELERWDTLSSRYDNVYYCREDMGPIDVADLIRTIVEARGPAQV